MPRQAASAEARWRASAGRQSGSGGLSAGALALVGATTAAFLRRAAVHTAVRLVHAVSKTGRTVTHELRIWILSHVQVHEHDSSQGAPSAEPSLRIRALKVERSAGEPVFVRTR